MDVEQRALIERLDEAVCASEVARVCGRVKQTLEDLTRDGAIRIPAHYRNVGDESYARRLLHRDPQTGYTVVVMTWGPGQHTELHDHAGMWCVECVVEGALDVDQYGLVEMSNGRCRFRHEARTRAGVGEAGALIPPYEYHVLGNALTDRVSMSLHVYAGEMDHCNLYRPADGGWWERFSRRLAYDD